MRQIGLAKQAYSGRPQGYPASVFPEAIPLREAQPHWSYIPQSTRNVDLAFASLLAACIVRYSEGESEGK